MAVHVSSLRDPAAQRGGNRALQVAECSLCGLERPIGLMVADGGQACDDLRWYCKDAKPCTERWTSRLGEPAADNAPVRAAPAATAEHREPAEPAPAEPAPAEPEPAEIPAEQHA
jgi:hypothetical protein